LDETRFSKAFVTGFGVEQGEGDLLKGHCFVGLGGEGGREGGVRWTHG
jgi:hypothetical protein